MRKIFVTGAPGWLGSRFVELTRQKTGFSLRCLVYPRYSEKEIKSLEVETIPGSVTDAPSLAGAMSGCDTVVHMVGIIHPKKIKEFYQVNYEGTKKVLQEALRAGVKRIVFISSNSPAGFSRPQELLTEENPPRPYMNYGQSKYMAEQLLLQASREKKVEAVILRPCWYYGPYQPARQTKFFRMIKKGNPVLFGCGQNLRSMSYIDNVVQAIGLAVEKEGIGGEVFWIADERPYTTLEIYKTVAELLGVKELKPFKIPGFSSWVFENADRILQSAGIYQQEIHVAGEMARNIACSIEKAKRVLGYAPAVSLKEGMRRSIEWCRQQGMDI